MYPLRYNFKVESLFLVLNTKSILKQYFEAVSAAINGICLKIKANILMYQGFSGWFLPFSRDAWSIYPLFIDFKWQWHFWPMGCYLFSLSLKFASIRGMSQTTAAQWNNLNCHRFRATKGNPYLLPLLLEKELQYFEGCDKSQVYSTCFVSTSVG